MPPKNINIESSGLPERLTQLRQARGLSKRELAQAAGVTYNVINDIEAEKRTRFQEKTLLLLAKCFELEFRAFVYGQSPWRRARKWLVAVSAALGASLILVLALILVALGNLKIEHEEHSISVETRLFGIPLFKSEHDSRISDACLIPWGPGGGALAYGLTGESQTDRGMLFVRSPLNGRILFQDEWTPSDMAAVFGEDFAAEGNTCCGQIGYADLEGDGEPELIVLYRQIRYLPSCCRIYRRDGSVFSTYYNRGHIDRFFVEDLDGDGKDEILLAGTNNRYDGATIIMLDEEHCRGAGAEVHINPACDLPDSAAARIVFAYFEEPVIRAIFPTRTHSQMIQTAQDSSGELRIITSIGQGNAQFEVILDELLRPLSVTPHDILAYFQEEKVRLGFEPVDIMNPDYWNTWLARHRHYLPRPFSPEWVKHGHEKDPTNAGPR